MDNLGYTIRHVIPVLGVSYTLSLFTHGFHDNVVQKKLHVTTNTSGHIDALYYIRVICIIMH